MRFHVLTIFPGFFDGPFRYGVVGRALDSGVLDIRIHDLRNWTFDRHRTVDDRPFGGGEGMVLKPEPVFLAAEEILGERSPGRRVILLSPQGRVFDQSVARRLSKCEELLLIAGRYEGIDERVAEHLVDEEISIGDYVLSGGELAAAVVIDGVARLLPGVVGNEQSVIAESFSAAPSSGEEQTVLLDCPHYTRPAEYRGWRVPDVLLSGNHGEIRRWRRSVSLEKTARLRPELIGEVCLAGSVDDTNTEE